MFDPFPLAVGLSLHGWSRGDVLALIGIVVAILVAVFSPIRKTLGRWWRELLLRAGFSQRKYASWFVRTWGTYDNPYLDDTENLDLRNTFVPLSFQTEGSKRETVSIATEVLADRGAGNLVIEGGPGSGKSTLLKAYGVGLSMTGRLPRIRGHGVPFLIQLRKLARYGNGQLDIAEYLVKEVLISGAGMTEQQARRFLRYSLGHGQVLVMLDGLDEVTADRYPSVLESVYRFVNDHSPDCPSALARVIVTCRRQNFLGIREEWIPVIAARVCSLAPLRDSDIFSYVNKLRPKFRGSGGPEGFFQAVRASGTLDLHRVPLILAMSAGLYARKDFFEIPSSIAKLYQAMVEEMLDRHRFKRDPGGSALSYQLADKVRFLREFSLDAARDLGSFDEFGRADLEKYARSLAPDLNAVRDPDAFVGEIIDRSGLLIDVGESNRYVFAHRSIQEYLAAERLRLANDIDFLLERAADPEWRQVIQFYAVGLEQALANDFLPQLAGRNPELAGYCLAGATPSDDVASTVLDSLEPIDDIRLTALAAATMSPRVPIQRMAVSRLRRVLAFPDRPLPAISGEVDALLPLLDSLAGTNAADIAGLVPTIIAHIPDDPRLVGPLWRCLTAPGIELLPAASAIVGRLLDLATSIDGFTELARQDPYTRDFLTPELRHRAYPFTSGLPLDHNLVTLLAWADFLNVTLSPPNRYFEAKAADELPRVEAARRRTIAIAPYRPMLVLNALLSIAGPITAGVIIIMDPERLHNPFGWWTLLAISGTAISVMAIFMAMTASFKKRLPNWKKAALDDKNSAHFALTVVPGDSLSSSQDFLAAAAFIILVPLSLSIAPLPIISRSLLMYFVATIAAGLIYWCAAWPVFDRGRRYYLYRPCRYIDVYDDPRGGHWVAPAATDLSAGQPTR